MRTHVHPDVPSVLVVPALAPVDPARFALGIDAAPGGWTVRAVAEEVRGLLPVAVEWVLFAPADAEVDRVGLTEAIAGQSAGAACWMGAALADVVPVITHHYAPPGLRYPDLRHGVLLSRPLLEDLCRLLASRPELRAARIEIDPGHELAVLVEAAGAPPLIDHAGWFRPGAAPPADPTAPSVRADDLMVAVRTWSANHHTRVPVLRSTWGPTASHLVVYSDQGDDALGTVATGLANDEGGCRKLWAIFDDLHEHHPDHAWYVIADDDSLINLDRLAPALSRLRVGPDEPVMVGERYGCAHVGGATGFDFLTLGAGAAINRAALRRLVDASSPSPDPTTPDDLWLGQCAGALGIALVHHPGFHQDQPASYPAGVLADIEAISFHRHQPADPHRVWTEWLGGR